MNAFFLKAVNRSQGNSPLDAVPRRNNNGIKHRIVSILFSLINEQNNNNSKKEEPYVTKKLFFLNQTYIIC